MQAWRGPEIAGLWGSERLPGPWADEDPLQVVAGRRFRPPSELLQSDPTISQQILRTCGVYVRVSTESGPTILALYDCVDAEDAAAAAAAASGMDAVMGCWFSSDMMDAAHYADRTLLVQPTTLLTHHPEVRLELK